MKIWSCLFVLVLASGLAKAAIGPGDSYYVLESGDVRSLDIGAVGQVAVGDPKIVNYKILDNGQLLIVAQKQGKTMLQVWHKDGRISRLHFEVRVAGNYDRVREIREMLKDIPGITVSEMHGHILVEGQASQEDMKLIDKIVQSTGNAISLVKPEPFHYRPLLRLDVRIVEVSNKASSQLGIRWDSTAGGPVVGVSTAMANNDLYSIYSDSEARIPGALSALSGSNYPPVGDSNFYGYLGITSSIGSQIDIMAQTGEANLLAAPKLVAKSGEEANFLSGGEFPVQTTDGFGQASISFQDYGIKLKIKPVVDDQQRISTSVYAEVSSLDFSVAIRGVPGLLTRKVDSVVNVRNDDTIVISGLASAQNSKQVSKVPFLGDLPLVGGLFRSTGRSDQKTELIILVTPHIVSPYDRHDQPLQALGAKMIKQGFGKKNLDTELME